MHKNESYIKEQLAQANLSDFFKKTDVTKENIISIKFFTHTDSYLLNDSVLVAKCFDSVRRMTEQGYICYQSYSGITEADFLRDFYSQTDI